MTHPLAGHLEVDESAKTVRHYRYAVERMTRILGGWMALTPELSAKLLMGRHVWDSAQHADAWGKRLPELRAAAQVSEPANASLARNRSSSSANAWRSRRWVPRDSIAPIRPPAGIVPYRLFSSP